MEPRRRKVLIYLLLAVAATALMVYSFVEQEPDLGLIFAFMGGFALSLARLHDEPGGRNRWKARSYLLLAAMGGGFFIYALYRLIAFGEQYPARFLGGFGGLGFGLALSAWADLRSEDPERREPAGGGE